MATHPKHRVVKISRHEWVIGDESDPSSMIARTLRDGIHFAQSDMKTMGLNVDNDDAYKVRVGDNEIILYVEIENDE